MTEGSFDAYMWQALETKARFIGQVMTGETGVRKAEDIGGQELSFAEVKAIASGNPAVLTLAEADAELQRLATLRKHHADEQYLARRNVRELPQTIAELKARLDATEADRATARAHADDPVTLGGQACPRDKLMSVLGACLERHPAEVGETRRFPLGTMRGLEFGLVRFRYSSPEVYLEGAGVRRSPLSRESQGPRAVLNALERLFSGYELRGEELRRDLTLAEGKLRDFEARLGGTFPHERYIEELSALRDELKVALSTPAPAPGEAGPKIRTTEELSGLIKALQATHSVEAAPAKRPGPARAERPVTARIRREREEGQGEAIAPEPEAATEPREKVEEPPTLPPPALPQAARKPVVPTRFESRPKRYQKWLF